MIKHMYNNSNIHTSHNTDCVKTQFGKNTNINASLRANKRMATKDPTAFKKKWVDNFGSAETDKLMAELQNLELKKGAVLSDNMYYMLWNDLADVQPIGMSEMPKKYLDMPNGRIFYAYKTFAIKQFNYMRNLITNKNRNAVQRAYDATYFATMFVLANSSIDQFKDFMAGKELNIEDKVTDNLVSMVGTSKYAVDKSRGGMGSILLEGLTPVPLSQGFRAADHITREGVSMGDVIDQTPIVGKLNRSYNVID